MGARARLSRLSRPRRARGLGQDPTGRDSTSHPRRAPRTISRAHCSARAPVHRATSTSRWGRPRTVGVPPWSRSVEAPSAPRSWVCSPSEQLRPMRPPSTAGRRSPRSLPPTRPAHRPPASSSPAPWSASCTLADLPPGRPTACGLGQTGKDRAVTEDETQPFERPTTPEPSWVPPTRQAARRHARWQPLPAARAAPTRVAALPAYRRAPCRDPGRRPGNRSGSRACRRS